MSTIKFSCPQCGNESFKVAAEPKSYEEFIGAECAGCGRALTDSDIKEQATAAPELGR